MAATTTAKVSLRLLIDTKGNKVLFAEASKEFVDFLCSLLSLPMATVIRTLSKQGMVGSLGVGSLGDLYESIENLSESYLQTSDAKDALLKPDVHTSGAALPLLLPEIQTPKSTCFFGCGPGASSPAFGSTATFTFGASPSFGGGFASGSCSSHVTNDPTAICPQSGNHINRSLTFVDPPNKKTCALEGGYVKGGVAKYMIMDNLEVRPISTISGITIMLNQFNVKDLGALEEKVVDVGVDQSVELLKMSLQSKTVLTEVFLGKKFSFARSFPWQEAFKLMIYIDLLPKEELNCLWELFFWCILLRILENIMADTM
ncbi:hypothetical protein SLEP1_g5675 [Rubroshorea leprosula]|uniref:DUF674 family protein n=1 Tax=Rubroshorea leprosula TaxID=152421 RepID=A0AAV5I0P8_9ROSI|nr:hypothetical protein SLEP1_g5675 [Rubroshorea leprosula]